MRSRKRIAKKKTQLQRCSMLSINHYTLTINHRLKGGTLLYVLALMLIIGIMSSALISKAYLNTMEMQGYADMNRMQLNAVSGLRLLMADKEMAAKAPLRMDLYDTGADSVSLERKHWGALDLGISKAFTRDKAVMKIAALGFAPGEDETALMVTENDRPLSVCGDTRLKGKCFLPKLGTRPAYIEGRSFSGKRPVEGLVIPAPKQVPPADQELMRKIGERLQGRGYEQDSLLEDLPGDLSASFSAATVCYRAPSSVLLNDYYLQGNIIVYSPVKIRVRNNCRLNDVVLYAPKIEIDSGFTGSLQAFASDSLIVGKNCKLEYPSLLGLVRTEDSPLYPVLRVGVETEVAGSVFAWEEKPFYNRQVKLCLDKKTLVQGEVYSSGQADVKGTIEGRLICSSIVLVTPSSVYDNHLLDAVIDRTKLSKYYAGVNVIGENRSNTIVKWLR